MGGWGGKLGSQMNISNSRAAGLVFIWVVPLFSSFFICLSGRPLYDLFFNIFPLMKMDKFFLIRMIIIIMGKKRKRREKRGGGREREKKEEKRKKKEKKGRGEIYQIWVFSQFLPYKLELNGQLCEAFLEAPLGPNRNTFLSTHFFPSPIFLVDVCLCM